MNVVTFVQGRPALLVSLDSKSAQSSTQFQSKSLPDGLVARQEDAMRQVIDIASQIHNDASRALARIGA